MSLWEREIGKEEEEGGRESEGIGNSNGKVTIAGGGSGGGYAHCWIVAGA